MSSFAWKISLLSLWISFGFAAPGIYGERDTCNRDNLLRCFIATSSLADPFCNSYMNSQATTVVVTVSPVPVTVVATSVTTTTQVISSVDYTTSYTTSFVTITEGNVQVVSKRSAVPSAIPPPACMTKGTSYPASRISSACSCLFGQASTTTTTTLPASTVTLPAGSASTATFSSLTISTKTLQETTTAVVTKIYPTPTIYDPGFELQSNAWVFSQYQDSGMNLGGAGKLGISNYFPRTGSYAGFLNGARDYGRRVQYSGMSQTITNFSPFTDYVLSFYAYVLYFSGTTGDTCHLDVYLDSILINTSIFNIDARGWNQITVPFTTPYPQNIHGTIKLFASCPLQAQEGQSQVSFAIDDFGLEAGQ